MDRIGRAWRAKDKGDKIGGKERSAKDHDATTIVSLIDFPRRKEE